MRMIIFVEPKFLIILNPVPFFSLFWPIRIVFVSVEFLTELEQRNTHPDGTIDVAGKVS